MSSITTKIVVNYSYDVNNNKNELGISKLLFKQILLYRCYKNVYDEISAGFIPNHDNYKVNKALNCVSKKGNIRLVKLFIEKGANDWNWGMYGAAKEGHLEIVKFFRCKIDT